MLTRLTDEECTAIVTLSPVWVWLCLPHPAGGVKMQTGVAGLRRRWGEPAPSGASRR